MTQNIRFDSLKNFENIGLFEKIQSKENFVVQVLDASLSPQKLMYLKMHQCYSEYFLGDEPLMFSEKRCGEICVTRLLESDRGHYGILESPTITFACGFIDHDTIMQARTHRVGTSFAVQSMRYTSKQFIQASENPDLLDNVIFINKGFQSDRHGNKAEISEEIIEMKKQLMLLSLKAYASQIEVGIPPEAARDILPHNYRQHFVVTFNLRSLLHFCDLRLKKDAQNNIVTLAEIMYEKCCLWSPEITQWYTKNRKGKARLAP